MTASRRFFSQRGFYLSREDVFLAFLAIVLCFLLFFVWKEIERRREVYRVMPTYLEKYGCVQVNVSFRKDTAHKVYQCGNDVFLDDEIEERVRAALRNNRH